MMYEWLTGTLNGVDYVILKAYRKPVLDAIKIVFVTSYMDCWGISI